MIKRVAKITKKIVIISFISLLITPQLTMALTFNPNFIMSDNDLVNSTSMSVNRIQSFLDSKGALGSYVTLDPWGNQKTAAQIISDAGTYWGISPEYLMVRMQIEQSLITDPTLIERQYDWATGYGVCDSCSTSDPNVIKYKGFFNQVNWAARALKGDYYLGGLATRGTTISGWAPGITKTISDTFGTFAVTPVNDATAVMYTYTPHVYNGNFNIWTYWNRWFTKNYPDGSLLQAEGDSGVFLIQLGKKRPFYSRSALVTRFDVSKIILVSPTDLDAYETGKPIRFPNYSLIRSTDSGRVFLIDGDNRRYIESPEVFRQIGFNPEEIIEATDSELNDYTWGDNITINSIHPTGILLQSQENGGISYVENGIRHSIWSREIFQSRFANRKPVVVEQTTIDQYEQGDNILFRDGELVTSPGTRSVFIISNGQRRPVASADAFNSLSFEWSNLITTTDKALSIHPLGESIGLE
ncbi:MAG: hypothetical protein ACNFW9_02660 [Candidatus Kerfeldbacteria bacterium]